MIVQGVSKMRVGWLAALAIVVVSSTAWAGVYESYHLVGSFAAPAMSRFDALPDGRLLFVGNGGEVFVETATGSRSFVSSGALPGADMAAAAFVRVSPGGDKIAVGNDGGVGYDNYQVGVFLLGSWAGGWYDSGHYDARWVNPVTLVVTAGEMGSPAYVAALNTASPFGSPDTTMLIEGVAGASGGLAFDAAGRLYTGNGYAYGGGSPTGTIKAFDAAAWQAAMAGGAALDFEADGTVVADVLSASALGFDGEGNLHIGGGSYFDDFDYWALASVSDVAAALAGGAAIGASDVRGFDPEAINDYNGYFVTYNDVTGELYAMDPYGSGLVFVYDVPEPVGLALLGLGGVLMRRRRS